MNVEQTCLSEERLAADVRWEKGLAKTRGSVFGRVGALLQGGKDLAPDFWDEMEALLILADVGVPTTVDLVERVRACASSEGVRKRDDVRRLFKEEMVRLLTPATPLNDQGRLLTVILVIGVNGSGKTTSIAKLARYYQSRGRKTVLAAADTFRAAAIDQLKIWGERVGVDVIAQNPGSDPGAVVFDAIRASRSRNAEVLIVDTAGRLHTKYNLMQELQKIRSVATKQVHQAPHETLLVLDATTGQNALAQARHFKEAVQTTGVIIAKLDGTAKGGVVLSIAKELGLPIRFVGLGEKPEDFAVFDPQRFVDSLFANGSDA
jgi:fused signal recognition particle receptor